VIPGNIGQKFDCLELFLGKSPECRARGNNSSIAPQPGRKDQAGDVSIFLVRLKNIPAALNKLNNQQT